MNQAAAIDDRVYFENPVSMGILRLASLWACWDARDRLDSSGFLQGQSVTTRIGRDQLRLRRGISNYVERAMVQMGTEPSTQVCKDIDDYVTWQSFRGKSIEVNL
jgi:hypothetical protein